VTLLVASQLGRKGQTLFVPAMNEALSSHPLYTEHTERLKSWGAGVWEVQSDEGRWKTPSPERVAEYVIELEKAKAR